MSMLSRALIALLAGIGAGLVGFWAVCTWVSGLADANPSNNYDAYLVCGIFAPFIAVTLAVYWALSRTPAGAET